MEELSENRLRLLVDSKILSVLDALSSESVGPLDLLPVAMTTVDFDRLLDQNEERSRVLEFLSEAKQLELESRLGSSISAINKRGWSSSDVRMIKSFFGLLEDRIPNPEPPSRITVEAIYSLFDHQRGAVTHIQEALEFQPHRCVLHFPTGAGKTRTAMHLVASVLRDNEPSVVVWLASARELLEQATSAFEEAWHALGNRQVEVGRMWGDRQLDLDSFEDGFLAIGLSKGWSTMSGADPEWAARLSNKVRLVVFDEAHQSVATTYRRIAEDLTLDRRCLLLGLTATPGRTWADIDQDGQLADFYGRNKVGLAIADDDPIAYLIENGYLARPTFRTLLSEPGLHLDEYEMKEIASELDLPVAILDGLSISEQYLTAVLASIEELVEEHHERILVFAASVRHAQLLAGLVAARGFSAAVVTGDTPSRERDRTIRKFLRDDGSTMVLINFGVLTTGFDAPKASAVVIARPTKSLVLFSQMVGRAIRGPRVGGTSECVIVTVVDPSLPGFGDVANAFNNWEDVW